MLMATVNGIGRVRPFALHPFQIGKAWAIHMLVEHTQRNQGLVGAEFREGQFQFALLGIHRDAVAA
jgi:hypothetical protein